MTQDGALLFPPRPDAAMTWAGYVAGLRALRAWAGARDDAELAAAVPGLTVRAIDDVLGERHAAVPDRRTSELVVRACLLVRGGSDEEIAGEQALWRSAWDRVHGAEQDPSAQGRARGPERGPGKRGRARGAEQDPGRQGRTLKVAVSVLFPAVTGLAGNLATGNMHDPWLWGALATVLAVHAGLLLAGPSRWFRTPLRAAAASLVAVVVTGCLVLAPVSPGGPPACAKADPRTSIKPPVEDPDLGVTWERGFACENAGGTVHAGPGAATAKVGRLDREGPDVFLCVVEAGDGHWYRTVADEPWANGGWGYISQAHVRAQHPVPGIPPCPAPAGANAAAPSRAGVSR
ncbi:hypothetical protein E1292_47540 [Nonomuraea deserti]|uniref:SH3 domain-containing protein n=1 Tax=Nonomuraea deserti TaxID=1848322 RepID=A0A4R4UCU5_9ACTN|nr:hypothetical protein [Nonomuraea deserti]TDC86694.1 hypothetical protein E1292_47540 [Nonomuraea deserti]